MFLFSSKRSRDVTVVTLSVFALFASAALPIGAASEGEVSTTVEAASACITVEASSVDFGTNPFSTSAGDEVAVGTPDTDATSGISYALTNCASAEESFSVVGTDATGTGATWILDDDDFLGGICDDPDGTTNRYRMDSVNDDENDDSLIGDSGVFLSTAAKPLPGAATVAASGVVNVGNRIVMPCTGSDGANTLMSSTITYIATLN